MTNRDAHRTAGAAHAEEFIAPDPVERTLSPLRPGVVVGQTASRPLKRLAYGSMLAVAFGLMSGCASSADRKGGGYYLDDGPGKVDKARLARMMKAPDPVPVPEKLRPRANRPYTVMGQHFVPMTERSPYRKEGVASWYGQRFHGKPTAIGETYDMYQMTAAHPTLPLPSYARVRNLENGRSVIVRVNDRGPFLRGRLIDLSFLAAHKLGYVNKGHARVEVELLNPGERGSSMLAQSEAAPKGNAALGSNSEAAIAAANRHRQSMRAGGGAGGAGAATTTAGAGSATAAGATMAAASAGSASGAQAGDFAPIGRAGSNVADHSAKNTTNRSPSGAQNGKTASTPVAVSGSGTVPASPQGTPMGDKAGGPASAQTAAETGSENRPLPGRMAQTGAAAGESASGPSNTDTTQSLRFGPASQRTENGRVVFEGWGAETEREPVRHIDLGHGSGQDKGEGSASSNRGRQESAGSTKANGKSEAAANGRWYLQLGVFRQMDNALRVRREQQANSRGGDPGVEVEQRGEQYVVLQGPYANEKGAREAAREMEARDGLKPRVSFR